MFDYTLNNVPISKRLYQYKGMCGRNVWIFWDMPWHIDCLVTGCHCEPFTHTNTHTHIYTHPRIHTHTHTHLLFHWEWAYLALWSLWQPQSRCLPPHPWTRETAQGHGNKRPQQVHVRLDLAWSYSEVLFKAKPIVNILYTSIIMCICTIALKHPKLTPNPTLIRLKLWNALQYCS